MRRRKRNFCVTGNADFSLGIGTYLKVKTLLASEARFMERLISSITIHVYLFAKFVSKFNLKC